MSSFDKKNMGSAHMEIYKTRRLLGTARPCKTLQGFVHPYKAQGLQGKAMHCKILQGFMKSYKAKGIQEKRNDKGPEKRRRRKIDKEIETKREFE